VKALSKEEIYEKCCPLVVCDVKAVREAIRISGLSLKVRSVSQASEGEYEYGTIDVLDLANVDWEKFEYKKVSAMTGQASYEYIEKVIEMALSGEIDATVTGPICKESLAAAGCRHPGHTEIFASLTKTKDYTMMLADGEFRVVHVSTHVSLREACRRVKKDRVLRVIELAADGLRQMGIREPRVGVAALNPHGGEGGLFGREEEDEIRPAVEEARRRGEKVWGPVPADTVYSKLRGKEYDVVVAMYHDQGHIPVKLGGFRYEKEGQNWTAMRGVNVTLGLPIIRSSVDHGVAFGKAGEGRANAGSMEEAIWMAVKLVGSGSGSGSRGEYERMEQVRGE
jgi:4-hydroxythreonine-4-phosphate dehydrogenase